MSVFTRLLLLAQGLDRVGKFNLNTINSFAKRYNCNISYKADVKNAAQFKKNAVITKAGRADVNVINRDLRNVLNSIQKF